MRKNSLQRKSWTCCKRSSEGQSQKDYANFNSPAPQFTEYIRQILKRRLRNTDMIFTGTDWKYIPRLDTRFQKHALDAVKTLLRPFQKSFNGYWNWNATRTYSMMQLKNITQSESYKKQNWTRPKKDIWQALRQINRLLILSKHNINCSGWFLLWIQRPVKSRQWSDQIPHNIQIRT